MAETEKDLSKKRLAEFNALINRRPVPAINLQMQMKQAHWYVEGPMPYGVARIF